jgi:gas vesicle protein
VLFAPKSGEDTRRYLLEKSDEGRDYVKRRSENLREQAGGLVDRGKGAVTRQKEQLDAAINAGKQAYREAVGSPAEAGDATE